MTLACDMMNTQPASCLLDTPVKDLVQRFASEDIEGLLVVDEEDNLYGVITESDLIEPQRSLHIPTSLAIFDMVLPFGEARFEEEIESMQALTARQLMTAELKTVGLETSLEEIASLMSEVHVHYLPVLDDGVVKGVIGKHDVIRELAKHIA